MTESRPLRTALIGFGKVAAGLATDSRMARWFPAASHAQILRDHPAFAWDAVVDPDPAARARATDWGVAHVCASVDELAAVYDPEILVLATPPGHRAAAVDAFPGLRGLLAEKPLGLSLDEAEAFKALCDRRALPVQVNLWRRGVPTFQALAGGGLEARIGAVQAAFGVYGNGLRNNGSHLIDFARLLLGAPVSWTAAGPAVRLDAPPIPGDIHRPFAITFASGATLCAQAVEFAHYREVGLDLWGTRGRLSLMQESLCCLEAPLTDNRGLEDEREIASDRATATAVEVAPAFRRLYDNLADVVLGRTERLSSPLASAVVTERILQDLCRDA